MRYVKHFIAVFALSAILLCMPLFSVSAAGCVTDWTLDGPLVSDFSVPAGRDSIVFDVQRSDGVLRRLVLPNDAFNVTFASDGSKINIVYNSYGDRNDLYHYYGAGLTSYNYYLGTNGSSNDEFYYYIIDIDLSVGTNYHLCGVLTNSSSIKYQGVSSSIITVKPFPDENLIEEKKTQGMISQLISDIADWFSNLIEKMGNFFTELGNKIGGFFTDLANKIGDFFTKLWNKIWWGNEAGESEYEPPDVSSKFDEVIASLNDWLSQLKGFSDTVDSQGDEVAEYVSTGSNAVTKFLSYAPAPILIFLTFAVVFVVVRKVVGR